MTGQPSTPAPDGGDAYEFGAELTIGALATDQIVRADSDVSIRQAAEVMDAEGIGLLLLGDVDGPQRVISERDVMRALASGADLDGPASEAGEGGSIYRAFASASIGEVATEMME